MQQIRSALTLFNGISGLHLALDKAQITAEKVYYSEIDKFANKVTEQHYPNDIPLGDVTKWKDWDIDWASVDLVSAGFPCQSWSGAGKQLGDKDERGMLFWTTLDIIKTVLEHNPNAKFLMENVKMKKDFEQYITYHTEQALGKVEKILINSALVSAQNRNRYYWTNFEVTQPEDKGILLKDILELEPDEKYTVSQDALPRYTDKNGKVKGFRDSEQKSNCLTASMHKGFGNDGCTVVYGGAIRGRYNEDGTISQRLELNGTEKTNTLTTVQKDNVAVYRPCELKPNSKSSEVGLWHIATATDIKGHDQRKRVYSVDGKAPTLQTCSGGDSEPKIYCPELRYRKLTPLECERLQTVPDNWTACLSNTQRYKSLGNGWTIDVIVHILKCAYN